MTNTEKLLYNLTNNLDVVFKEEPGQESGGRFIWSYKITNNTYLSLENIKNELIEINIKTDDGSNNIVRNTQGISFIVPIKEIEGFIEDELKKLSNRANEHIAREVKNIDFYENLLENVLKEKSIDGFEIAIEREYDRTSILVQEGGLSISHLISLRESKSKSLLEPLIVNFSFLIAVKNSEYTHKTNHLTHYYLLSKITDYPLLGIIIEKDLKGNKSQTLESVISHIKNISKDNEFLKLLTYHELNNTLDSSNKQKKLKI